MPTRPPGRLGGHLRRHVIGYAAMAVAVSFSPVPSMAAGLVTTADIKKGAVTTPKLAANSVNTSKVANGAVRGAEIKDGSVTNLDLSATARGAKVTRYDLGPFDFSAGTFLKRQLPGTWTAQTVAASTWTVSAHNDSVDRDYLWPGHGQGGATTYRISISSAGEVYIDKSGPGEPYSDVRLYRTVATSTRSVPSARIESPGPRQSPTVRSDR